MVDSMHERKALMAELADAFCGPPWRNRHTRRARRGLHVIYKLGLHRKPCGLLDVEGYYQRLADFLDHAVQERFLLDSTARP